MNNEQLMTIIERIEHLNEEKQALANDIKEVYAEAKGNGFNPKIIREIVKLRKMDDQEREETEQLIDLYKHALGL